MPLFSTLSFSALKRDVSNFLRSNAASAFLRAILFGLSGAIVANFIDAPLPWLLGPLAANVAASMFYSRNISDDAPRPPQKISVPQKLNLFLLPILGGLLGRGFSPETFQNLSSVGVTMGLLFLLTASIVLGNYFLFRLAAGNVSPTTAFLASAPGGVSEIVAISERAKADFRVVVLSHSVRLSVLIMVIPYMVLSFSDFVPNSLDASNSWTLRDTFFMALAVSVGGYIGYKIIPAGHMIGAMLFSAVLHYSGVISSVPPVFVLPILQLMLGSSMGARFCGYNPRSVFRIILRALIAVIITLILTCVFAYAASEITGIPFIVMLVSYAPGGMSEMALVAFSIGLDPGFVVLHHIARWFLVIVVLLVRY